MSTATFRHDGVPVAKATVSSDREYAIFPGIVTLLNGDKYYGLVSMYGGWAKIEPRSPSGRAAWVSSSRVYEIETFDFFEKPEPEPEFFAKGRP